MKIAINRCEVMMGKCIGLRPIRGTFALGKKYNRTRLYKRKKEQEKGIGKRNEKEKEKEKEKIKTV
jgi:hypothetical protein